jgi:RNA polymerase primary sigma factor
VQLVIQPESDTEISLGIEPKPSISQIRAVHSTKVRKAVEALVADYHRQGRQLTLDQITRTVDKRGLEPDEALEVWEALERESIRPTDDDPNLPENDSNTGRKDLADLLGRYLDEISSWPLLSADEEKALARRIHLGRNAKEASQKSDAPEQIQKLAHLVELGRQSWERMVHSNLRLVISIARRYEGRSQLTLLDLVQEGSFGLFKAIDRFDPTKDLKFSTYATWWIRQTIHRGVYDRGSTIRIPVHAREIIFKIKRVRRSLRWELQREPTTREIADYLRRDPEKVEALIHISQDLLSLDAPLADEESTTLAEVLPSSDRESPENLIYIRQMMQELFATNNSLTVREKEILSLRFGIEDGVEHTLEEIGTVFGVTRERIRQIENRALGKARRLLSRKEQNFQKKVLVMEEDAPWILKMPLVR